MKARLLHLLGQRSTYLVLVVLNVLVGGANVLSAVIAGTHGNDHHSYMALAEGIRHGHYSMYWYLPGAYPDTFRAPGFPGYMAAIVTLFGSWRAVGVFHTLFVLLSVHLTFRTMGRFGFGTAARSLFLLLLLSSQNILVYVPLVNPEIPAITCLALMTFGDPLYRRPSVWTGIGLGALAGFLFQCRPIFLLLPFVRFGVDLLFFRKGIHYRTMMLYAATYLLSLLPFALWNKAEHGIFRATPLEGGGGVYQIGWWAGRFPGYHQHRYWGNFAADEMVRFVPADSIPRNIAAYEREWDGIDSTLAPLLTAADTDMLAHYREFMNEKSYNARYTLAREAMLKRLTTRHMLEHPGYTLSYKLYTAVRLWVIGVDRRDFQAAGTLGRVKLLAPFLVTLFQFLLAITCIPLALRRKLLRLRDTYPLLLPILYGWAISIPFAIQSRYTVPLRFLLFALMAMSLVALLERRSHPLAPPDHGPHP